MTTRPQGQKFSQIYREKGEPVDDSMKFRRRLAYAIHGEEDVDLIDHVRRETGLKIYTDFSPDQWISVIASLDMDQVLDLITIVSSHLFYESSTDARSFIQFVSRAMAEENLQFEIDERGGVHFRVDGAFQASRQAAIDALNRPGQAAARVAFEEAQRALVDHPGDSLTAVRRAFDAVENIFKMTFGTSRLGETEIQKHLKMIGDAEGCRAGNAARRINDAFGDWVNACHQYRHAPSEADPSPPPRWLAVALVDGAATYIRYLTKSG